MEEDREETGIKQVQRDDEGHFLPGVSGNPAGRPKGSVGYETLMNEAIKEYSKINKIPETEIRKRIYMVGVAGALNKDYQFYKDFMDRTHGKALQPTDLTSNGQSVVIPIFNGQSIPKHDGDQKDIQPPQENPGSGGGNISQQDNLNPDLAN